MQYIISYEWGNSSIIWYVSSIRDKNKMISWREISDKQHALRCNLLYARKILKYRMNSNSSRTLIKNQRIKTI